MLPSWRCRSRQRRLHWLVKWSPQNCGAHVSWRTFQQAGLAVPPVPRQSKLDPTNINTNASSSRKSLQDVSEDGERLLILRFRRGFNLLDQRNNDSFKYGMNMNPTEKLINLLNLTYLYPIGIEYGVYGSVAKVESTTSTSWLDNELLARDNTGAVACLLGLCCFSSR